MAMVRVTQARALRTWSDISAYRQQEG